MDDLPTKFREKSCISSGFPFAVGFPAVNLPAACCIRAGLFPGFVNSNAREIIRSVAFYRCEEKPVGAGVGLLSRLGLVRRENQVMAFQSMALRLVAAGFIANRIFTRWEGLVLFGALVIKVFLVDLSSLDTVVRIVSFLAVGTVLLGIAFLYQRVTSFRPRATRNSG